MSDPITDPLADPLTLPEAGDTPIGDPAASATDAPLNREQRRAARFRPKAGRADPHAVSPPAEEQPAAPETTGEPEA